MLISRCTSDSCLHTQQWTHRACAPAASASGRLVPIPGCRPASHRRRPTVAAPKASVAPAQDRPHARNGADFWQRPARRTNELILQTMSTVLAFGASTLSRSRFEYASWKIENNRTEIEIMSQGIPRDAEGARGKRRFLVWIVGRRRQPARATRRAGGWPGWPGRQLQCCAQVSVPCGMSRSAVCLLWPPSRTCVACSRLPRAPWNGRATER